MAPLPLARFRNAFADIAEGHAGYRHLSVMIELSAAAEGPVVVSFASVNGSALAGEDYDRRSGSVTFAAGETAKNVLVRVLGDTLHEANETFSLELTRITGAAALDVTRRAVLATIVNDDPLTMPAAFLVTDSAAIAEGASGTRNLVFTVGLSEAALSPVRVTFATSNGSARAGEDYAARAGTLVFAPGEIRKTFAVPITGDLAFEANETFYVDLTGVTGGAALASDRTAAIGTILNDDVSSLPVATFASDSVSMAEGSAGTRSLVFTMALSTPTLTTVRVGFETANGSARAGEDYVARSGTVSFAPGETRKSFAVTLLGDTAYEADETFYMDLTTVTGGAGRCGAASACWRSPPSSMTIRRRCRRPISGCNRQPASASSARRSSRLVIIARFPVASRGHSARSRSRYSSTPLPSGSRRYRASDTPWSEAPSSGQFAATSALSARARPGRSG